MNSKNKKTVILVFFCRIHCDIGVRPHEPKIPSGRIPLELSIKFIFAQNPGEI